jgi:hypothetical protein
MKSNNGSWNLFLVLRDWPRRKFRGSPGMIRLRYGERPLRRIATARGGGHGFSHGVCGAVASGTKQQPALRRRGWVGWAVTVGVVIAWWFLDH